MNTEKLNAIKETKSAIRAIRSDLVNHEALSLERDILEDSLGELEGLVWDLINQDLKAMTAELSQYNVKLIQLSAEIKETNINLKKIGERVEKIAKIAAALVKAVEAVIKTGR